MSAPAERRRLAWSLYFEGVGVGSIVTDLDTQEFAAGSAATEAEARSIARQRLDETPSGRQTRGDADLVAACRASVLRPGDVPSHLAAAVLEELDRARADRAVDAVDAAGEVPTAELVGALARLREQLVATPVGCAVQLSHGTAEAIARAALARDGQVARPAGDDTAPLAGHNVTAHWDAVGGEVLSRTCSCGEEWTRDEETCPEDERRPDDRCDGPLCRHGRDDHRYGTCSRFRCGCPVFVEAADEAPAAGSRAGDTAPSDARENPAWLRAIAEANADEVRRISIENDRLRSDAAALRAAGDALAKATDRWTGPDPSIQFDDITDALAAWRSAAGSPTTDAPCFVSMALPAAEHDIRRDGPGRGATVAEPIVTVRAKTPEDSTALNAIAGALLHRCGFLPLSVRYGIARGALDEALAVTSPHEPVKVGSRDRALQPPAGLPVALSSVDDAARVCEAAGLQRVPMQPYADRWLGDLVDVHVFVTDGVLQRATVLAEAPATQKLAWHIEHGRNAPASSLWSAIQAARGGEHRG